MAVAVIAAVAFGILSWAGNRGGNPRAESGRPVAKSPAPAALPAVAAPADPELPTIRGTYAYVVECEGRLRRGFRETVEGLGAGFVGYRPPDGCLIEATPEEARRIRQVAGVRGVRRFRSAEKLSAALSARLESAAADAQVEVTVALVNGADLGRVSGQIAALGGRVCREVAHDPRFAWITAEMPPAAVAALQTRGEVKWMEPMARKQLLNDVSRRAIGADGAVADPVSAGGLGLTGAGQLVGQYDTGVDDTHPDFEGRIYLITNRSDGEVLPDEIGHGTHTAGSIVGTGAATGGRFAGVAPGAQLYHQQMAMTSMDADDAYSLFIDPYLEGARIHSDSWGDTSRGVYGIECQMVDLFHWKRPSFLAVFSAGNSGCDMNADGVVDLGSVCAPAAAKNVLAVGATASERAYDPETAGMMPGYTYGERRPAMFPAEPLASDSFCHDEIYSITNGRGMAAFSSRGPTLDGRLKPDVCAPGSMVVSCRSSAADAANYYGLYAENCVTNELYGYMGGTSMSCPLVAGAAALMREWLAREGYEEPSAALLRAMMIGGAHTLAPGQYGTGEFREIPGDRPNPVEGWGEVDVRQTLAPSNAVVRLFDRVDGVFKGTTPAAEWSAVLNVTNSSAPLVVALVWTDYPADPSSVDRDGALALVNDYDLVVTDPDGREYRFNGGDHTNVQETVSVAAPVTGSWTVTVKADGVVDFSGGAAAVYARGAMELVRADAVDNTNTDEAIADRDRISFSVPVMSDLEYSAPFVRIGSGVEVTFTAQATCADSSLEINYEWYFDGIPLTNGTDITEYILRPDDFVPAHDSSLKLSELFTGEFLEFKRRRHYVACVASVPGGGITSSSTSFRYACDVRVRDNDDVAAFNRDQLSIVDEEPQAFAVGDRLLFASGVYEPLGVLKDGLTFQTEPGAEAIIDGGGTGRCVRVHPAYENRGVPTTFLGLRLRNGCARDPEEGSKERDSVWYTSREESPDNPWTLDENFIGSGGGAVNAVLVNCTIENCEAPNLGGAAYHCELYGCTIVSNRTLSANGTAADYCAPVVFTEFRLNADHGAAGDDHAALRSPRKIVDGLGDIDGEYWNVDATWTSHYEYFGEGTPVDPAAGTTVWSGDFAGRNLDCGPREIYLLRMPANEALNRLHASIGVAIGPDFFDEDEPYEMPRYWHRLPWRTLDGINDAGLCILTAVAEGDPAGPVPEFDPWSEVPLDAAEAARLLLDGSSSAEDAVGILQFFDIYSETGFTFRWTICDTERCYVAECGSEGLVVTEVERGDDIGSRLDLHEQLSSSRTPGGPLASIGSCAYDLALGELSVMVGNNPTPFRFSIAGGFGEWPYADPSDLDSPGWVDPATRGGDIPAALNASGVFYGNCSCIDASGYARLVAWASTMGMAPRDIDEMINGGAAPLTAAAFNNMDGFGRESDPDFEYTPRITAVSAAPTSVTLRVALGNADLLSADQGLLRAALGVIGSEALTGGFSDRDLEFEVVGVDSDSAEIRVTSEYSDPASFFFKAIVR